jgi:hypothetical protein
MKKRKQLISNLLAGGYTQRTLYNSCLPEISSSAQISYRLGLAPSVRFNVIVGYKVLLRPEFTLVWFQTLRTRIQVTKAADLYWLGLTPRRIASMLLADYC